MPPKRTRSPPSASAAKASKKAKTENPTQKHLNVLKKAVEETVYPFPCRELLSQVLPLVLEKPVEARHEFEIRGCNMVTEAVTEALELLKEQENELQYKVNNTEEVKTDTENKLAECCSKMKELEEQIAKVEATVKESNKKLSDDEKAFQEEADKAKEHEDRYDEYKEDFQLLTTTLEEFNIVVATPPTTKKEQSKHQSSLEKVLKKFFPIEKTISSVLPQIMYKGADAHSNFEQITLAETQKLFNQELSAYSEKIEKEKPDTTSKDAKKNEVDKSTKYRDSAATELREMRRKIRELTKTKKELDGLLKNHPKNVQKWENELKRMSSTIETYVDTVMVSHDFLVNRPEVVQVPADAPAAEASAPSAEEAQSSAPVVEDPPSKPRKKDDPSLPFVPQPDEREVPYPSMRANSVTMAFYGGGGTRYWES